MRFLPGLLALCALGLCSSGAFATPTPVSRGAAATAPRAIDDAAHEHDVAQLSIRVDGDLLALRLRLPLKAALGRETPPRTPRQRQAARQMAAILHDPQSLFVPTAAARCTAGAVTLRSEAIDPHLLAAPRAEAAGDPTPAGSPKRSTSQATPPAHADLHADIDFRCAAPQALSGLQVRLFDAFPALRQVDAAIVTPRGDSGARLSPNRTSLTW